MKGSSSGGSRTWLRSLSSLFRSVR
jgi:hypothetical protein